MKPATPRPFKSATLVFSLLAFAVAGCGVSVEEGRVGYPYREAGDDGVVYADYYGDYLDKRKTVFGEGGVSFFDSDKKAPSGGGGGGSGIGVNSFLWRATLETITFMPVSSADPFGGVIITDWHSPAESPTERFKLNIYLEGRALRADGVKVAVFRQIRAQNTGGWRDAPTPSQTSTKIEDAILTKARHLRSQVIQR